MTSINTLGDLMRAVATATFGGYGDSFEVGATNEHSTDVGTYAGGGFLILHVSPDSPRSEEIITYYVGCSIFGEWWIADDRVMQVL